MKKYLIALSIVALFAGVIYAADSSSIAPRGFDTIPDRFGGAVTLLGKTPRTTMINVDNVTATMAVRVAAGGGTYLGGSDNTLTPIAATISCPTTATRWAFGATPSATVGHVLAADGSWQLSGPDAIGYLKGYGAAATDNVACAVTLWY
jgi:hypothetical protein